MKNNIYKIALVLSVFIFALSCENSDDATGGSVASPSNPSLSVSLGFASNESLVETEADYEFTVSLSEPQITAVVVYLELLGSSTATEGDDFSFPHSVRIPAGSTSVSDVITIHADDLIEETETVSIKIGTGLEANVSGTNSETVNFNIMNFTDGDLAIGLDWALGTTITDNFGNEIGVYDAADLRLLLTAGPNVDNVLDGADGASAETYVLDGAAPDGDYYIVADFYAASEIAANLDLTLTFDQAGVINGQTHTFPAGLNTSDICADLHTVLAKITKTGTTYAFEEVGEKSKVDFSSFVGTWSGDATWSAFFGYTSEVVTTLDAEGGLWITGVSFQWFEGWWGEVIISNTPVEITSYDPCTGDFAIAEQPYVVTTWNGDEQPAYGLSATGNISNGAMTIYPIFHQGGGTIEGTDFTGGIEFVETLTLD